MHLRPTRPKRRGRKFHCTLPARRYAKSEFVAALAGRFVMQDSGLPMKRNAKHVIAAISFALAAGSLGAWSHNTWRTSSPDDAAVSAAICAVVYPLDESSSERGYHYVFYGNAFFINSDGYLITAAHVLSDFHDGGQPHILLRLAEAPPRPLKVHVVATDQQHDIAVLRAVPNPFEGRYQVAFLPLASGKPESGRAVFAAAVRPSRLRDPHTFDASQEERSPGEVLRYISTKLDKGQDEAELFLFSHEVRRGQSGAPVMSRDSREVVGIVEGQWLHAATGSSSAKNADRPSMPGAAVPIIYSIPLLEVNHIVWQTAGN